MSTVIAADEKQRVGPPLEILVTEENIDSAEDMLTMAVEESKTGNVPEGFSVTFDLHESDAMSILMLWPVLEDIIERRKHDISSTIKRLHVVGPDTGIQDVKEKTERFVRVLQAKGILCPISAELK